MNPVERHEKETDAWTTDQSTPAAEEELPLRSHSLSLQFINQKSLEMSSQLEEAMETLISVFHTYSAREGDKHKLSRRELKDLLQNELGDYLETQKDAGAVDKIMKELDENGDGEVDFQEFVILVASLTVACNTFFCESS
ncbi:protein S100-A1 isoform X1 [Bufo gargarizans]|uniref:protein S100-A1 isoform X1 n=1 Tax=Bufo gargarizans TaxID=30331 RepID=UPI001CF1697B|nr:protein S100-A1 isoform X1 [Bufo gargarizans]